MPAFSENETRCPSPPSDYEPEEEVEYVGEYTKTEIIRLFLSLQEYLTENDETEFDETNICALWVGYEISKELNISIYSIARNTPYHFPSFYCRTSRN